MLMGAFLLSVGAFAQSGGMYTGPAEPQDIAGWFKYEFYACDSNGQPITSQFQSGYKKFYVEIYQTIYGKPPSGVQYTIVNQVADKICQTGDIGFMGNVRVIKIEYGLRTPHFRPVDDGLVHQYEEFLN